MKKLLLLISCIAVAFYNAHGQQCFFTGNDTCWRADFVGNGTTTTSRIVAMVAKPDGLYCLFESPIGLKLTGGAPSIAAVNKWNGSYWQPVGPSFPYTGSSATFTAMTADSDGNLIIGGRFTTSLGSPCLVKLNLTTQSYEPIGMGISSGTNYVQKIAVYKDTLYVLGRFTEVKDSSKTLAVKNIARFYLKTHRWDSMGSGIADFIQGYQSTWIPLGGLDVSPSGEVFVAGNFTTIGTKTYYNGIASWKTGRGWDTVGSGLRAYNGFTPSRGIPYTLSYNPDDSCIYVGGYVGYLLNAPVTNRRQNGIARFKNGKWAYNFGSFSALTYQSYYDSTTRSVFYGGGFARGTGSGNLSDANRIARFDNTLDSLFELNYGITAGTDVSAIVRWNNQLYVAGNFSEADSSIKTYNLAVWDGSNWSPVGHGIEAINNNAWVKTFATDTKGNLLVGGNFKSLGGLYTNAWALIDSNHKVHALNNDIQTLNSATQINAILPLSDSTYLLGGKFSKTFSSGNSSAIAGYNTNSNSWFKLGTYGVGNIYQYINCMAKVGNKIVVGGSFSSIDGVSANNLAYWDGTQWNAMGDPNGEVEHLTVFNDSILYIEGYFSNINGSTHNYIARYDSSTWRTVGVGLYSSPQDIAVHPYTGELWVITSGSIPNPSGPSYSSNGYAVWDGTKWKDYGKITGFIGNANSIYHAPDSTTYFTASGISKINNVDATNILRYHPAYGWAGAGSGIRRFASPYTPDFYALRSHKNRLYIGGRFDIAGDSVQSFHLAAYSLDNPLLSAATISLGNDDSAYYGYSIKATTSPEYDSLIWSTGNKNTLYSNVFSTGYYSAILYNKGCAANDTVHITIKGNNIYTGGSGDGNDNDFYAQYGTLKGGGGNGASTGQYNQYGTITGGNGDGVAFGAALQNGTLKGGFGDGFGSKLFAQNGKIKGGSGDGGANQKVTQKKTIFKGGSADGFSMATYTPLPDGTVRKIISPVKFNDKDSSDLSALIANIGDYPILAFKVNWFVAGKLYTFSEFNDSIPVGDSLAVKALQRILPSEKDLPLDICVLITNIAREKDTANNQLCYILDKTTSIAEGQAQSLDINIYPNPTANVAWLQITATDEQESDFELINTEGKVVLNKHLEKGTDKIEIDLQNLSAGIYHFAYTRSGNIITGKLAVVK